MILSTLAGGSRAMALGDAQHEAMWRDKLSGYLLGGTYGSPEVSLQVSVVHRAINVIAHAVAGVPLNTYERKRDGSREVAERTTTYRLLHDAPNAWMTSFRWRHMMVARAILYGDAFYQLLPGPGGISQIVPLEPQTTRVVEQLGNGKLVYVTRDKVDGGYQPERRLTQDSVLRVCGMSLDGKTSIAFPEVAKKAIELSLLAEKHGAMFLRRGSRFVGVLSTDSGVTLTEENRDRNQKAWQSAYGGPEGTGGTPLLEGGLKYQPISANNRDSQWLEARTFQVEELLRFLGVPGVLVGYPDKTATYASAEQFFLSFVKDTVHPWTENIAAELNRSVVIQPERFFCEFDLDGLLKGDIKTRYEAHRSAIMAGWKNRQEVRREENYAPGPSELEEFLEPVNMIPGEERPEAAPVPPPARPARQPPPADDEGDAAQAAVFADALAGTLAALRRSREREARRAVRRETNAMKARATKHASNPAKWQADVFDYYEGHVAYLVETLELSEAAAREYAAHQRRVLMDGGLLAAETWEGEAIARLVALAMGEAKEN